MKTIIFTNNDELKERFSLKNFKSSKRSNLHKLIQKNIEKLKDYDTELYPFLNAIDPQFLFQMDRKDIFFVVLNNNEEIIASLVLGYNEKGWDNHKEKYMMHSVSVDEKYQGQGYAKHLINILFDYCKKNKITGIRQSAYTKQGQKKIKKIFKSISSLNPEIKFKDTSKKSFFN